MIFPLFFFVGLFFDCLFAWWISRAPRTFARFAVVPVGSPITVAVPPGTAALALPPREETATYREMPAREFALTSLPGEVRGERYDHDLHFGASTNEVLVRARGWWTTGLIRLDISGDANALVVRARRLPTEILWVAYLVLGLARIHEAHYYGIMTAVSILLTRSISGRERGRRALVVVVHEMMARLAIANGDQPPTMLPWVPKLTHEEWACRCGKVHEMKSTMCDRCRGPRPWRAPLAVN